MISRFPFAVLWVSAGMLIHAQDLAPSVVPDLVPLEGKTRMQEYLKELVRPSSIASNVLIAWTGRGTEFSPRMGTHRNRVPASGWVRKYAQFVLDNTIELGIGALHKEDKFAKQARRRRRLLETIWKRSSLHRGGFQY